MKTKIKIHLKFLFSEARLYRGENSFDNILIRAFAEKGIMNIKTRYTYVAIEKGRFLKMAEMPHSLMCVMFIIDHFTGFDWKLPEFSGDYIFEFNE